MRFRLILRIGFVTIGGNGCTNALLAVVVCTLAFVLDRIGQPCKNGGDGFVREQEAFRLREAQTVPQTHAIACIQFQCGARERRTLGLVWGPGCAALRLQGRPKKKG